MSGGTWKQLQRIPNQSAFRVLTDKKHKRLFIITSKRTAYDRCEARLSQYSFKSDSWEHYTMLNKDDNFKLSCRNAAAINRNTIYLTNKAGQILIFNLNNDNQCEMKLINGLHLITEDAINGASMIIKDEFHIFGGGGSAQHVKYNEMQNICNIVHDLGNVLNLNNGINRVAMTKIKKNVLLFGGLDASSKNINSIHEYNVENDKWKRLQTTIPNYINDDCGGACTAILHEKIVLLFGNRHSNCIYIYYVDNQTFTKSEMKCPAQGSYQAIVIHDNNDKMNDKLITFGYIRCQWKKCDLSDHLFPPEYLIKIILSYYMNDEWIHLFSNVTKEHFKINAIDIIRKQC